ncbi:hypothetical protein GCK72_011182 [Caenorhabditis remanei]|uniref:Uncharacterized protein n=1 Tax=Caenorhabditis remanei TaxID=31234 RepID=A0A6A5H5B0_CAERE|nr:hypothetical protein GCK72_011182 [Caenorhabditis remanei]KAF1762918.1 hypothetical protein GCK72_011182 [Caenorhabditis remanei]
MSLWVFNVDTFTEDSSSLLPVILFVVFLLLLLVGVGIVVVYRFCFRRSESDRDVEYGGVPRNERESLWLKLMKQELESLKNNYKKVVESEAKKEEELLKLKEESTLEKEKNRETILTLKAENAANERVIQQLLDKLTPISSNEDRQKSIHFLQPTQ